MSKIKGLIFDMDGTLVPNMSYHSRAFEEQARRHGYKLRQPVDGRFFGWHKDDVIRAVLDSEICEKNGVEFLADEKEEIYRELYRPDADLTPGLRPLIQEAKSLGIGCAIGSAGPRENVEFIVEATNSAELMDVTISGNDVQHCKPNPEIFLTCCERLGQLPAECVVFEDAISGVQAGVAAGCKVVAISTTTAAEQLVESGAHLVVDSFEQMTIAGLEKALFGE
ncbi:MAG: HAD family phosphatase [Alistipes sp.]|nr:HAD family phosphatase [Alistipes sp.]